MSRRTALQRFWMKVAEPDPVTGCWMWLASVDEKGYGYFWAGSRTNAHRFAYEQFIGPIPDGMFTLHYCDTPGCVNPRHLWLGTHAANMRDRDTKGRALSGERAPSSKLRTLDVLAIRARLRRGATQVSLANEYGVTSATISRIANRDTWKRT